MKRVIIHWTAGAYTASSHDKAAYHFLIEGDGTIVNGKWPVLANVKPSGSEYAAHTRGANTGAIGVSMCCMGGAIESPFNAGKWPMTKVQWDKMILLVADLCRKYDIPVTNKTVLTHAEVEKTLGIKQAGKWDITRLAFDPSRKGAAVVGDYLRAGVAAAMIPTAPKDTQKPVQSSVLSRSVSDSPKLDFTPIEAPAPSLWARIMARIRRMK